MTERMREIILQYVRTKVENAKKKKKRNAAAAAASAFASAWNLISSKGKLEILIDRFSFTSE